MTGSDSNSKVRGPGGDLSARSPHDHDVAAPRVHDGARVPLPRYAAAAARYIKYFERARCGAPIACTCTGTGRSRSRTAVRHVDKQEPQPHSHGHARRGYDQRLVQQQDGEHHHG